MRAIRCTLSGRGVGMISAETPARSHTDLSISANGRVLPPSPKFCVS